MGTIVSIDVYASGDATAAEIEEVRRQLVQARAILQRADTVFSTWQPGSAISRLRAGEITTAEAPAEVADVLSRCATARELSGGWFDPWAMPGGIDPTGLVKGWAAQQALAAFTAPCIVGAMVNAAGDIASYGDPGTGEPFRVGIANPAAPRRLAEIVSLTGAIATSGSYERGGHLIDPYSAHSAVRVGSASVTGSDLALADALATALAVAGEPGLAFIRPLDGYEALIIGLDGCRRRTEHFPLTGPQLPGTRPDHRPPAWPGWAVIPSSRQLVLLLPGDLKQRAAQRRGGDAPAAAGRPDDGVADRQAQAGSAAPVLSALEPVEQLRPLFRRDAGAAVLDGERQPSALGFDTDPDPPIRARVAAGVVHQHAHQPVDPLGRRVHQRRAAAGIHGDRRADGTEPVRAAGR
jgi:FAD:protein FMN transferase